jgi:hypothetical protein
LIDKTELVSGGGSCNDFIAVSRAEIVGKVDTGTERGCKRTIEGETSKARRILGNTWGSHKMPNRINVFKI